MRYGMASAETVELPKDRKGRTLRLGYEVLVFNGSRACGQGEVTSLTLAMMDPAIWFVGLQMGAVGDRRYRTSCDGFAPDELERIEVDSNGSVG